jgi:hypothetical protein
MTPTTRFSFFWSYPFDAPDTDIGSVGCGVLRSFDAGGPTTMTTAFSRAPKPSTSRFERAPSNRRRNLNMIIDTTIKDLAKLIAYASTSYVQVPRVDERTTEGFDSDEMRIHFFR